MAIKKSDLYSSIWASCDELRGGMDASQYKDYVLFMLFIKYVSDKYADYDGFEPPIVIPKGASFKDMELRDVLMLAINARAHGQSASPLRPGHHHANSRLRWGWSRPAPI